MAKSHRSHPPSLWRTVKKALEQECKVKAGDKILLGVSGGSDSMALMSVLARLQQDMGITLCCVGINHQLRNEAADEVLIAKNFAESMSVDFKIVDVVVPEGNVQAMARDVRYEALFKAQREFKADYIATAHHMEDRAETVLMKMMRGSTKQGLTVLEPRSQKKYKNSYRTIIRPMIRARKSDVMLHIERKNIPYSDDPSNKKVDVYTRSKVRYQILPLLQEVNPNVVQALCDLSDDY